MQPTKRLPITLRYFNVYGQAQTAHTPKQSTEARIVNGLGFWHGAIYVQYVRMITAASFTPLKHEQPSEAWWATGKQPLRQVAPCILNISVTISNTERLHKDTASFITKPATA